MPHHNLQKLLQPCPSPLNNIVAEAIRKDLAWKRGDGDPGALALEDVAEVLEVGVAAAHARLAQLEGGDVGAAQDLVVGVHVAADAVGAGVAHLDLKEVLGRAVDLVERLLARVGHGLEDGAVEARGGRGGGRLACPFPGGSAGGVGGRRLGGLEGGPWGVQGLGDRGDRQATRVGGSVRCTSDVGRYVKFAERKRVRGVLFSYRVGWGIKGAMDAIVI